APSMPFLIWMRAVQGLGGGMIFASVFATMGDLFSPAERGKYIGLFTGMFGLASVAGPPVGGFLTDHLSWRWVFYINVPVSLVAMPAIWFNLPRKVPHLSPRLDLVGALLLSASSVALLLALVWGGEEHPWGSVQIVGLFVASAVSLVLFIFQESRHPEPILPLHLFRNQVFLVSNTVVFMFGLGVFGAFSFLGLYLQTALEASATKSGFVTLPQSIGVFVSSFIGGQVISRRGKYKWQTVFGAFLIAASMGVLTTVSLETKLWQVSVILVFLGFGFGLVLPTMSLVVQNAVSQEYIGVASSSSQFFRQIGSVIGIAIFGAILANSYGSQFTQRFSPQDRQTLGPAVVAALEAPTIRLNEHRYAAIQQQVLALPNGAEILQRAERAQGESVVVAVHRIFLASFAAAILCLVFALILKELPLRRNMGPPPGQPATNVNAPRPAESPTPEPIPGGDS
ncbi:MAG TPA: MFS transporter, partial [Tepidiformaceae bacterium]|nr:MFS transporter [Tepidiformaceae bacterium]